jgi:hypothetical protein
MTFSEPIAAKKQKYGTTEWTLWDRFTFKNNPTLKEIIDWFKKEHNLDVGMVSQGVSMLWSSFIGKKKGEERLPMKFSKLVETVSKKPIPPHAKHLITEIMVSDEEGEDVEVGSPPDGREYSLMLLLGAFPGDPHLKTTIIDNDFVRAHHLPCNLLVRSEGTTRFLLGVAYSRCVLTIRQRS